MGRGKKVATALRTKRKYITNSNPWELFKIGEKYAAEVCSPKVVSSLRPRVSGLGTDRSEQGEFPQ